ncbi:hypothetical protein JWG39_10725 [Desulforhopalus vacuolatus]|uniref:hypothetical protein n=1 Tax=Desulforhopalus vacuolatus TaxID=40414 RepID=UPI001964DCF2|nr:hypothetical protein [Desulforhopalus vacuolatus]MBM9520285.1 hypothetical protein [Desulforhopalus vacuolatus]
MAFIKNARDYPSHFFDAGNGTDPIGEILHLAREMTGSDVLASIKRLHYDIVAMFSGKNPEFKRNTMPYHTLRHTLMVALAVIRFFYGLHFSGHRISGHTLFQGMLCAYFHDSGMLLKSDDPATSGVGYISIHEKRSAQFLTEYVKKKELLPSLSDGVDIIIAYTWLGHNPATFPLHSKRQQMLGHVVGAADLLAQMADCYYLENLPLLFDELERGKLNTSRNVREFMEQTETFYRDVVLPRFTSKYSEVFDAMVKHFVLRYGINRNLYMESINKNLKYLQIILDQCKDLDCIYARLRRRPPRIE